MATSLPKSFPKFHLSLIIRRTFFGSLSVIICRSFADSNNPSKVFYEPMSSGLWGVVLRKASAFLCSCKDALPSKYTVNSSKRFSKLSSPCNRYKKRTVPSITPLCNTDASQTRPVSSKISALLVVERHAVLIVARVLVLSLLIDIADHNGCISFIIAKTR